MAFVAERHLPPRRESAEMRLFAAFGAGPHACSAQGFVETLSLAIVVSLLRRVELELVRPAYAMELRMNPLIAPRSPIEVRVRGKRARGPEMTGPDTLFWMGDRPALFVHDPAGIKTILIDQRECFVKSEPAEAMRPAATESNMFIANGASWAERRRLDFFSCEHAGAWLDERFVPTLEFTGRRLCALPRGELRGFERSIYRLIFDIQSFLCLGRRIPEQDFRTYNKMTGAGDISAKTPLQRSLNGSLDERFDACSRGRIPAREGPTPTS